MKKQTFHSEAGLKQLRWCELLSFGKMDKGMHSQSWTKDLKKKKKKKQTKKNKEKPKRMRKKKK